MFEAGDKIVCINTGSLHNVPFDKSYCLTLYKTYTVIYRKTESTISIMNDQNLQQPFSDVRFIPLTEYRKQKLQKICSKLEM